MKTRREVLGVVASAPAALVIGRIAFAPSVPIRPTPDLSGLPEQIEGDNPWGWSCIEGIWIDGVKSMDVVAFRPRTDEVRLLVSSFDSGRRLIGPNGEVVERWCRPRSVEVRWKNEHGPDGKDCQICAPWRRAYRGRA